MTPCPRAEVGAGKHQIGHSEPVRRLLRAIPRGAWWALAGAGFVTLILLVVLWFPRLIRPDLSDVERDRLARDGTDKLVAAEDDRSNAQNSIRTTLLQGIAGVALLTGAYFAYRGLEASRLQLKATEDGQITTRYTEAVKLLGDKEPDICIGGIYALQRIARDSDRDRPTVVALLSAFVRRSAPKKKAAEESSPEGIPLIAQAPDVEIALRVLAELGGAHLHSTDFRGANLHSAVLRRADLALTDLTGADLRHADLRRANLFGALLPGANIQLADLRRATLERVNLGGADFSRADLSGADLVDAYGDGADFTMARGADLRDVRSPGEPVRDRDHDEADDGPK
jgi:Pentapeptide repeats (8 copies)